MITRLRAVAILHQHYLEADTCSVGHNHLESPEMCESFNTEFGIHSTYSLTALKRWLGY